MSCLMIDISVRLPGARSVMPPVFAGRLHIRQQGYGGGERIDHSLAPGVGCAYRKQIVVDKTEVVTDMKFAEHRQHRRISVFHLLNGGITCFLHGGIGGSEHRIRPLLLEDFH